MVRKALFGKWFFVDLDNGFWGGSWKKRFMLRVFLTLVKQFNYSFYKEIIRPSNTFIIGCFIL
jgi:hypothetical protein